MESVKDVLLVVKWSGKEFIINDLVEQDTVAVLKHEIFRKTQVRPERQKLLNLKYKNKLATDDLRLHQLELKTNFKIMMMGSTEEDIESACTKPEGISDVIDDFDDIEEKDNATIEGSCINLNKVQKRIKDYVIKEINPPRKNKKLLVLDIDYTLFDHRSSAETGAELMRPFLHDFLTSAYENYDIVIWSATGMKWIEEKMKLLGVSSNTNYKIAFYLDSNAMISIYTSDRGVIDVKPLGVIWGKYPEFYSSKNTIMFDDIRRNFLMNPKSGLRIRPFRQAHINRSKDTELLKLKKYLLDIAENCEDFTTLNHKNWESYTPKKL